MNTTLLLYSSILSFSGFAIAFYGILAESKIEKITSIGINKRISFNTDKGAEFYAEKFEKWKAGSYFVSKSALPFGILVSLSAGILNILDNPLWTFIVVLISGYITYLIIAQIIGWYIQTISILTTIISSILIIINLI
jgi:hypothetical protein